MSRSTAWMLVLMAAPASGLQAPGALRMHRGDSFAVASASRGAALTMQAGDDRAAVESKRARFLRPLRSASTSVAATVLLALVGPRGAARAAVPLEAPTHSATTNSRSVENAAAPFTLRTLSPRRGTVDQMEEDLAESRRGAESADVAPYGTDMEQLVGRGLGRQFMSKSLIFGEELTEMTPLQEELDELDEYTSEGDGFIGKFKGSFTYLATGGVVYGVVKILQAAACTTPSAPPPRPPAPPLPQDPPPRSSPKITQDPPRNLPQNPAGGRGVLHHEREADDAGGDGPDGHVHRDR